MWDNMVGDLMVDSDIIIRMYIESNLTLQNWWTHFGWFDGV